VVLDIECPDRIYLNAYVPILQTSSQVVAFLSGHLLARGRQPGYRPVSIGSWAGRWLPASQ
jgi:hypothetical protein